MAEGRYLESWYSYPFPSVDRRPFHSHRLETDGVDFLVPSELMFVVNTGFATTPF